MKSLGRQCCLVKLCVLSIKLVAIPLLLKSTHMRLHTQAGELQSCPALTDDFIFENHF